MQAKNIVLYCIFIMTNREAAVNFSNLPQDDVGGAPRRFSAKEIDVNLINKSLANVNNFSARRQNEKQSTIMMYEITSDGESDYKEMTLRELLNYVNREAAAIDEAADLKESTRLQNASGANKYTLQSVFGQSAPVDEHVTAESVHDDVTSPSAPNLSNKLNASKKESFLSVPNMTNGYDMTGLGVDDSAFSAVSELRLRDLRRLDYQFNPNEEKSVLIRRHAVLFAMDPMRAVVMTNRLILIVPSGADSLISILDKYMKGESVCARHFA